MRPDPAVARVVVGCLLIALILVIVALAVGNEGSIVHV
jgi:hypothetical protein